MYTEYNLEKTAISIMGDYCLYPVFVDCEVANLFESNDECFHVLKSWESRNILSRKWSRNNPFTMTDYKYTRENELLGYKHWFYVSMQTPQVKESTGYDLVYGYGYYNNKDFAFVNSKTNEIIYLIKNAREI